MCERAVATGGGGGQYPFFFLKTCVSIYVHTMAGRSVAAARFDDHVAILFEDDVRVVVKVQDGDGGEFDGRAARLGHHGRRHQVHQRLHDGVVAGVHVRVQRERTLAVAVKRRVAVRRDDPVLDKPNKTSLMSEQRIERNQSDESHGTPVGSCS